MRELPDDAPAPRHATTRYRLAPEWGCWPIWDDATGDNLGPVSLPVPAALASRIDAWDRAFQAILDHDDPLASGFADAAAARAHAAEGRAILAALVDALGAEAVMDRLPREWPVRP